MTETRPSTGDLLALIERAEKGVIPADLELCAAVLEACERLERSTDAVRWMAIAQAKRAPEFGDTKTGRGHGSPWIVWVMEHYPAYTSRSHIHHMAAVGAFLLHHAKSVAYHTLFPLPFDKLLALARLPEQLVGEFLDKVDVVGMGRSALRHAVNRWLAAAGVPEIEDDPEAERVTGGRRKGRADDDRQLDFLDVLFAKDAASGADLFAQVSQRAKEADYAHALSALKRTLVASDALVDRLTEEAPPDILAGLAKVYRDEADKLGRVIEQRWGRAIPTGEA